MLPRQQGAIPAAWGGRDANGGCGGDIHAWRSFYQPLCRQIVRSALSRIKVCPVPPISPRTLTTEPLGYFKLRPFVDLRAALDKVTHILFMTSSRFLGAGIYTIPEAERLTRVSSSRIRRWLKGYDFRVKRKRHHSNPVWTGQLAPLEDKLAVGFRDLMEIRFVNAFLNEGVSWKTMRDAHIAAKNKLGTDHPFCTHKFATDGREILLHQAKESEDTCLIDITNDQREFKRIVAPFLKELEFDQGYLRWWPLGRERLVVVDPVRNLGQPTVIRSGVPTRVLAHSVKANGSLESVAHWYEVDLREVHDAVEFESRLAA